MTILYLVYKISVQKWSSQRFVKFFYMLAQVPLSKFLAFFISFG